ncbi:MULTISPECIES: 4-Cys prefix domain-containing protein [Microcystis]|nr:4-Cys prefix domain-containing protein [Microcystis aeruginosa]
MSLCLNPDCSHKNTPTDKFCHKIEPRRLG